MIDSPSPPNQNKQPTIKEKIFHMLCMLHSHDLERISFEHENTTGDVTIKEICKRCKATRVSFYTTAEPIRKEHKEWK